MMREKMPLVGFALLAALLVPLQNANAWVAVGGHGGAYHGGGAYYHGGSYYHGGGCYGCGGAAVAVGVMAGVAIASAAATPQVVVQQPATVYVQQPAPVYIEQAPPVYAPPPVYATQGNMPLGSQVALLPPGAAPAVVNGETYYRSGPTWFKPYYGSAGVYYQVVIAPM